jgi:tetratricopeptide (TPR) repeat protein
MLEQARKCYQEALRQDPNSVPAYLGLARTYENLGNRDRARETYQAALAKAPKEASLWSQQGMFYARQRNWELALPCLRTACQLDPENRSYANALGYSLARAGAYDESLQVFKRHIGEANAHYNLARMLRHLRQDDLCEQHARAALELKPDLEGARQLLAELHGQPPGGGPSDPAVVPAGFTGQAANEDEATFGIELPPRTSP